MINGKVAQATNTHSQSTCTICGATLRQLNDLTNVASKPENENSYQYGLFTLNAWISCMEIVLHIFYNLSFQTWAVTSKAREEDLGAETFS